jgi:hypothetical protein
MVAVEWAVELLCRAGATTADPPDGVAYQSRQRIGSWSEHVTSWLDQDLLPVQLIRYEDALTDPIGVFTAAMRFIGLDVTEEEIAVAVSRSSFERLAAQEAEHGFAERVRPDSRFFRRGRSGGWREELPADLADLVVGTHRETMTRLGYLDR